MTRTEMLELLKDLRGVAYDAGETRHVKRAERAIAWLEDKNNKGDYNWYGEDTPGWLIADLGEE